MLCDLRLGLSLSELLYNERAPDTDLPVPQSFGAPGAGAAYGGWSVGCLPPIELALWSKV